MVASRGTEIDDRYRLEEPVGRGGMATVWRARDLRLGRDVAIKVIAETRFDEPGFVERFEREAQIAARLSHPNLVGVHDLGFIEDRPYLVMEFIDGETLSRRLERAPESVDEVELARTLLGVLAAIHDQGIVHRDVKPANVLYQDDGRIRLTDFGIARIIGTSSITATNEVIGTVKYMAPEVRDGTPPSPEADLYALGVLLTECGAMNGPLRDLARKLRHPDASCRPANARVALASIAGLRSPPAAERTTQRAPTEVLRERPSAAQPPTPPPAPAAPADDEPLPVDEPTPTGPRTIEPAERRPSARTLGFAAGLVAVLAVAAIAAALLGGGGDDSSAGGTRQASSAAQEDKPARKKSDKGAVEPATTADTATDTTEVPNNPSDTSAASIDPARGFELNAQGYELLQAGDAAGAVPLLQQAVASYPTDSDDINYAYALYNLGVALRESGRPEEAIPYLEQRLAWSDQRATVKAELEAAKAEAE